MKTWGLVLSGGVACGIANGGVIEVLEREGLRPDCIAGSSMGSIIAALYAYGIPVQKIHTLSQTISLWNIASISDTPLRGGLHGGLLQQNLHEHLYPLLGDARIGDCPLPLVCVAGRVKEPLRWEGIISRGFTDHVRDCVEKHVFDAETRILDAIMASSAVPVAFSPVEIDGEEFIDLLAFGSIPARTLRGRYQPEIIIATDTNEGTESYRKFLPPGWQEFLEESQKELSESRATCDLIIEPRMPYGQFRFDKAESFWEAGKQKAEEMLGDIRGIIL